MKPLWLAALLCLLPFITQISTAHAATINVDGRLRNYLVFRSASLHTPAPTVIVLHGGGGNAERMARYNKFGEFARGHGIVAIYPDGIDNAWNDGRHDERGATADDVTFLKKLVGQLIADHLSDPSRIYLTGMSNGGMMTLRMACEAPDLFAAVAVVAASQPQGVACAHAAPLPILIINGTDDDMVPYAGGPVGKGQVDRGRVIGHRATLSFWEKMNGCKGPGTVTPMPDTAHDGMTSARTAFACPADAPVVGITVKGGGHSWPGGSRGLIARMLLGPVTRDFSANEVIWDFFKGHRRSR